MKVMQILGWLCVWEVLGGFLDKDHLGLACRVVGKAAEWGVWNAVSMCPEILSICKLVPRMPFSSLNWYAVVKGSVDGPLLRKMC